MKARYSIEVWIDGAKRHGPTPMTVHEAKCWASNAYGKDCMAQLFNVVSDGWFKPKRRQLLMQRLPGDRNWS
jgi:hypothetical protein